MCGLPLGRFFLHNCKSSPLNGRARPCLRRRVSLRAIHESQCLPPQKQQAMAGEKRLYRRGVRRGWVCCLYRPCRSFGAMCVSSCASSRSNFESRYQACREKAVLSVNPRRNPVVVVRESSRAWPAENEPTKTRLQTHAETARGYFARTVSGSESGRGVAAGAGNDAI